MKNKKIEKTNKNIKFLAFKNIIQGVACGLTGFGSIYAQEKILDILNKLNEEKNIKNNKIRF